MAINFKGPAKRIEDVDLPRVGAMIGVGEDEIHAIMDVEAAGSGFDSQGRPKMLFEPHIFYSELASQPAKRNEAVQQGLAYQNWRPGAYPTESYTRLQRAMLIDETAALRSASWGLGQILGRNHKAAGYNTVQAMVTDFTLDEDNHLEAMIRFIKNNKLDDNIRAHDWHGFARGYNGAQYAVHGYHTKLANAYAKWARIKDTPYTPGQVETPSVPVPAPRPPAGPTAGEIVGGVVGGGTTGAVIVATKEEPWTVPQMIGGLAVVLLMALAMVGIIRFMRNRRK